MKRVHKLNLNENQFKINKRISQKAIDSAKSFSFYLDTQTESTILSKKIANKMGVSIENIMLANGIDEILLFIAISANKLKGNVVTTEYTYNGLVHAMEYVKSGVENEKTKKIVKLPINDMVINLDKLKEDLHGKDVSVMYICNPHNPIGNIMLGNIEKFLDYTYDNNIILFFDEAYAEYGGKDFVTMIKFAKKYYNIVVARTFSKAYGLAGLRCAYLITYNDYIIEQMGWFHNAVPYSINSMAYVFAEELIDNNQYLEDVRKKTAESRNYLTAELEKLRISIYPSITNFVLVKFGSDSDELVNYLRKNNFLVRNMKDFELNDHIRITIGTKQQMERLVESIKKFKKVENSYE